MYLHYSDLVERLSATKLRLFVAVDRRDRWGSHSTYPCDLLGIDNTATGCQFENRHLRSSSRMKCRCGQGEIPRCLFAKCKWGPDLSFQASSNCSFVEFIKLGEFHLLFLHLSVD